MRGTRLMVLGLAATLLAAGCSPAPAATTVPGTQTQVTPTGSPSPSAGPTATESPEPTAAPPATTAFSDVVAGGASGRLRLSTSLMSGGLALGGAPVTVTTTALGKTYQTLTLTGVVPQPAKSIIVQLGFNNQPDTGPMAYDIKIDRITYADGGKAKNRLPNGGFESGTYRWAVYGEGRVTTPSSAFSDGRVLRLRADRDEEIVINSFGIPVTPGSTYRLTVTAEVPPSGTVSGYVAAIFLKEIEIWRESIYVVAPAIPVASLTTGADGSIALDNALPAGRYRVRVAYAGDATHMPVAIEHEVTVK